MATAQVEVVVDMPTRSKFDQVSDAISLWIARIVTLAVTIACIALGSPMVGMIAAMIFLGLFAHTIWQDD